MDFDDYYYQDVLDAMSDGDLSSSSDEETDEQLIADLNQYLNKNDRKVLFKTTDEYFSSEQIPNCVRMTNSKSKSKESISFKDEMNNEIQSHIQAHFSEYFKPASLIKSPPTAIDPKLFEPSTSKTQIDFNNELLYDPEADEKDEEWIRSKVTSSKRRIDKINDRRNEIPDTSDAILNCPCCMTLVCVDCQQHDIYEGQFRAMFVQNCRVDYKERLTIRNKDNERNRFRKSKHKKKNRKDDTNGIEGTVKDETNSQNNEPECNLYYPVHCTNCHTQIALFDSCEVYHFFSVIASQ